MILNICTISTRSSFCSSAPPTPIQPEERIPLLPTCPAPNSPGTRGTPASTWSRLALPVHYLQTLCPPQEKLPEQTTHTKLITGLKNPPTPTPGPARQAQVTPPDKKGTLRAHRSQKRKPESTDLPARREPLVAPFRTAPQATGRLQLVYLPVGSAELLSFGAHAPNGKRAGDAGVRTRVRPLRPSRRRR